MFAKVFIFFYEVRFYLTPISCLFLFCFPFISEIRSDVLVLKNGERIKADNVKMKNGNLVEFRIGNVTKVIEFSKVDSILPEFSVSKKPIAKPKPAIPANPSIPNDSKIPSEPEVKTETVEVIPETTLKVDLTPLSEPEKKVEKVDKEETPFFQFRTSRTLQALVPGWSPLLLADDRKAQMTGGILALSELYVLYRGLEFFAKPEKFFNPPSAVSEESFIPYFFSVASSSQNGGLGIAYFFLNENKYVVTDKGHLMEKSDFYSQREFYGIALFSLIAIDVYLSNTDLYSGNLKSVRFSTLDGGRASSLSVTWVF
ncbi:hypothetical protein A0128_04595 [Leptospira tipperaryensis]|uniref:Uncharacterized protein n=1 Tax=Leptospira tipperaryensis TaxID=2564040 RepID=A0A1D7UUA9_9LEPT|nr:hypothetical protein [Leptospira tipperaryensis]AOP33197.1 hypothetical protein A0128_04595 [Leptospira tipperaryensis]